MEKKSCMMNPYVEQMEKFGRSLEHLADTFFRMEERKGQFTSGEVEEMFSRVSENVCRNCRKPVLVSGRKRGGGRIRWYMKF